MEISKPTLAIAAALCVVIGAGAASMLRSGPAAAVTDSAAEAFESSEAAVTVPPDVAWLPRAPAPAVSAPPRTSGEARTANVTPARPTGSATVAAASASTASPETPRTGEPARDTVSAPPSASEPVATADAAPATPPAPLFEELVVSADSVIGLEVETAISSEGARVEDAVVAQVTRDVNVGSRVAIPSGARAYGEVTFVERGGRLKERARLGVRFTSIVLADGTVVPIETDTIVREGSSAGAESSAKIGGGALGGAILGGILGGARGAIVGGSAGAGAGTAAVLAGGRNPATLSSGTPVTVRLMKPATVTVEK